MENVRNGKVLRKKLKSGARGIWLAGSKFVIFNMVVMAGLVENETFEQPGRRKW